MGLGTRVDGVGRVVAGGVMSGRVQIAADRPVASEHAPNPRASRTRSSAELTRSVREGRRFAEALRALGFRAHNPDDADVALADALARALVRRADTRHEGWRNLRHALEQAGAAPPWARCQRQAQNPTAGRILRDCGAPGTPRYCGSSTPRPRNSPGPWPRTPTPITFCRACSTTDRWTPSAQRSGNGPSCPPSEHGPSPASPPSSPTP